MAYIPDEWVMKRLDLALSAQQMLFYYCARADSDTGETTVSPERTSQDLGIRKDHVNEHDRKLVRRKFITITATEHGGRIVRLLAPWQSRAQRTGQSTQRADKKAGSQVLGNGKEAITQNLGSPLDSSPKLGGLTQNLGEVTQNLGEVTQNLGEVTQNLGLHIRNNQPMNQPNNQTIEPEGSAPSPFEEFRRLFPEQASIHHETVIAAAGIANFQVWQATLEAWKVNRYSVRNIAGIIDSYKKRADRAQQNNQGGGGYDQERQRRARRFLERSRTDIAAKYGHRR